MAAGGELVVAARRPPPGRCSSTETCSRTSEIWPCAARVTSISSSIRRPRRPTWRSRISRSRTRIGLVCSSVRSTLAALAIGASGLRSSCESIARNWPWRRSARRSCWVRSASDLLELLALVDVDAAADVAGRRAVGAEARHAVVEHPAVVAVVATQAQVHRERRARLEAGGADAEAAVEVFGMDDAGPAVAVQLVRRTAGVGGPRRAEPVVGCRRASRSRSGPAPPRRSGAPSRVGAGSPRPGARPDGPRIAIQLPRSVPTPRCGGMRATSSATAAIGVPPQRT